MANENGNSKLTFFNCKHLEYIEKQSLMIFLSQLSKWIPQELRDKLFSHLTQAHSSQQALECSNGVETGQFTDLLPRSTTWDGRSYWKEVRILTFLLLI
jgi:hypothetical protein